jgi:hypothetical protein
MGNESDNFQYSTCKLTADTRQILIEDIPVSISAVLIYTVK